MIQFKTTDGEPQQGEVWCPGPLRNTVWVLLSSGRTAVVHVEKLIEVVAPADPRNWRDRQCTIIGQPGHTSPHCCCADYGPRRYLEEFRYAPPAVTAKRFRQLAGL